MSAFRGKADEDHNPTEGLLVARSGHCSTWSRELRFTWHNVWELSGWRTIIGVIMPEGIANADESEIEMRELKAAVALGLRIRVCFDVRLGAN